jgi:hypothetical protein
MGTSEGDDEPFDILDVERFRALPSAMWLAFGSVWGIGLALRTPEDDHPVLFWMPIASVVLGWVIWMSYFIAQRRRINRKALQAIELDERQGKGRDGAPHE